MARRAHPGILPLSMPGLAVTIILGFMFSWNAFNYPLMLAGRQTFPVTVGAIQFISYEQVLWGQMAAATIVAASRSWCLALWCRSISCAGSPWERHDERKRDSRRGTDDRTNFVICDVLPVSWCRSTPSMAFRER